MQEVSIPIKKLTTQRPFHALSKPIGPLCNLDCEYCYYLKKKDLYKAKTIFDMNEEALNAHVKDYIESQPPDCNEVVFGWQGGEPTMRGIAFFERAVQLQKHYARPGMVISNTFQTNAVLINDKWARFLKEHNFLVGVSIDGDEELHDRYRKNHAGKGSHAKVIAGLKCLLKHGVDVNVLTVVQADNGTHGRRVYDYITGLGVNFIQFIPVVEPVIGQGVSDRSISAKQFGQFMIDVFEHWRKKDIGKVFVSHLDNALGMTLGYPSTHCVHSPQCGDNVAVEHNGDVYSCDHFVFPEFKLGNLSEYSYSELLQSPVQQSFSIRKPIGAKLYCQGCPQQSLCHGACPAQRLDKQGNLSMTARHYLCEGYYNFFSHIRPYLNAMAQCINQGISPKAYKSFLKR